MQSPKLFESSDFFGDADCSSVESHRKRIPYLKTTILYGMELYKIPPQIILVVAATSGLIFSLSHFLNSKCTCDVKILIRSETRSQFGVRGSPHCQCQMIVLELQPTGMQHVVNVQVTQMWSTIKRAKIDLEVMSIQGHVNAIFRLLRYLTC